MSRAFFEDIADALVGFLPPDMRGFGHRVTSRNVKIWYGDQTREHYEVQHISAAVLRRAALDASGAALEIGFHAEHPKENANLRVLERLRATERTVRQALGTEVQIGAFIGNASWGRASELWRDGDLSAPETAIEAADRLAMYIRVIEPIRIG